MNIWCYRCCLRKPGLVQPDASFYPGEDTLYTRCLGGCCPTWSSMKVAVMETLRGWLGNKLPVVKGDVDA